MNEYIPNLRGLVDARVEHEINTAIRNLYNYIREELKNIEKQTTSTATEVAKSQLSLFAARLAAPIIEPTDELATIGQETTLTVAEIPDLPTSKITSGTFPLARIPTNVLKTDDAFTITPGVIPVGGKITIKDNNGNSVNVLVE